MPIHLLPDEVASQIAAGEVIERPASVVKELLENAVDAGANTIEIITEGAGQRLIEIADNGSGIPAEELPLAVQRHATSKLQTAADLFRIGSLGFRGEALASIGSVARLTLTSRPPESQTGARLRVEGGSVGRVEPIGAPVGTHIRVEDLFYNVPARRKFLKSDLTERRQIDEIVTRYALAYPHIRFRLTQDGKTALQTSGNGSRRETLGLLYGTEAARQMLEVIAVEEGFGVSGFISPAGLTRAHRRDILFFINGRPVQDSALSAALLQGYHTLLMVGRYPLAALFIEMPPESVDVNVHPTKAEVRFSERERVFSAVQRAVRRALLAYSPVPEVGGQLKWSGAPAPEAAPPVWESAEPEEENAGAAWGAPSMGAAPAPEEASAPVPPAPSYLPGNVPILRLVGQIAQTYLIAEGPDGLYLIDQHAAHERILFERFMAQRSEQNIPAQTLLQPASVELPAQAARLLTAQLPVLERLGFVVEDFGHNTFLVRAIPSLLARLDPTAALRVLVEDFEEDETPLQNEMEAKIAARVCKRAAIKGGQPLALAEQQTLLRDLEACQSPRTCPHGRPTMIHLSVDLLERQFGRRGAR